MEENNEYQINDNDRWWQFILNGPKPMGVEGKRAYWFEEVTELKKQIKASEKAIADERLWLESRQAKLKEAEIELNYWKNHA